MKARQGCGRLRCGARRGLLLARWLPVERFRRAFRGQVFPLGESGGVPAPFAAVRRLRRARRTQRPQKPSRLAFPPVRGHFRCRQQLHCRWHAGAVMSARIGQLALPAFPRRRRVGVCGWCSPGVRALVLSQPRGRVSFSPLSLPERRDPMSLVPRPVEDAACAARPRARRAALWALRVALERGIAT